MKHVVCNLRVVMAEKGIKSVSELQRVTGLPRLTLDKLFRDETRQLSYKTAITLCVSLGCGIEELYRLVDDEEYEKIQENKKRHKDRLQHGVVYFIENKATGLTKVGKTIDINKRVDQLSREYGNQLELIETIESYDSVKLEKDFHSLFSDKRVDGEWFGLSREDIRRVLQEEYK